MEATFLMKSMQPRWQALMVLVIAGTVGWLAHAHFHQKKKTINFSKDIRPILNQNCVGCHGGVRQKGNVSFIFRDEALEVGKSGKRTIIPGHPDESELMRRVMSHDPETHMPYHGPMLSQNQIDSLREWIKEGADFDNYWAFVSPKQQEIPKVKENRWPQNAVDNFVLARLEKEGLKPSPEANPAELLRRVSLDITGLPPTAQEQAAFAADHSPNAYEKQVDRLLASPSYGERWASMWLDLARYADSMGYEKDMARKGVWVYRDWVIRAYNANLPYDQFVIKQLAGDLLPNATLDDRIATTFHRLTPNNDEGGTDDEEFRLVAVMDRSATTWNLMTGVTMNCVQCHSHPYDPIRHEEYYKALAFFNTQQDSDLTDDSPNIEVPRDKAQYAEAQKIENQIHVLVHSMEEFDRVKEAKTSWKQLPIESAGADDVRALQQLIPPMEKTLEGAGKDKGLPLDQRAERVKSAKKALDDAKAELAVAIARGGIAQAFTLRNGEAWANANTPARSYYQLIAKTDATSLTALRISVPPINSDTAIHTPENGFVVDKIDAWVISPSGQKNPIQFAYYSQDSEGNLLHAEHEAEKPAPSQASRADASKITTRNTHVESSSKSRSPKINPVTDVPMRRFAEHPPEEPEDIPSGFAAMPKLFETRWIVCVPTHPVQLAAGSKIQVDMKQFGSIDSKPAQVQRVRLDISSDSAWTSAAKPHRVHTDELFALDKQLHAIPSVPVPVMAEEQPYERRATLKFERGNFLTKVGPRLEPDVPSIFPKFPEDEPRNRLTLAKWFFQPTQPLTARVAVNRYWEEFFGTGIVETLENFGSVGEEPSNQALLDYLALHFQNDLHWNMKALIRELVTSATYRQSAVISPQVQARDPQNRLLTRGPRQRLTAEMVRDQALVASGLLSSTMGGAPVMPPQPAGIWSSVYSGEKWSDATDGDRYRRAIYTYIKRTSGYPSSLIFDASDRDTMLPRRIPTNTPLQALVTLNDPAFQEMAVALANRVVREIPDSPDAEKLLDIRLNYETKLVLSRDATPFELQTLHRAYAQALRMSNPEKLIKASFSSNNQPADKRVSQHQIAALATVGGILFNLDAALVR
jgi:hypothetical protein